MPTKAKKKATAAGKLAGKKVALVGKFGYRDGDLDRLQALVRAHGGKVVDGEKTAPDLIVAGTGVGGRPPTAAVGLQKKHSHAQGLDVADLYKLVAPTADEFLALLRGGPRDWQFWGEVQDTLNRAGVTIRLGAADLRDQNLTNACLYGINVDGADFRGATLTHVSFPAVTGAKFDGADMRDGTLTNATGCRLRKVNMHDGRFNPAEFADCDFSGAILTEVLGSYTRATNCSFAGADMSRIDFDQSEVKGCDFRGATLVDARLEKCDFTGADLSRADLTRADLRGTKLVGADLRRAKMRDAVLTGADLTDAKIDGADFTGANLTDVTVTNVDPAKAKNFRPQAGRAPGPNMRELAKVAGQSKKFQTSIELDLGNGETVNLYPSRRTFGPQGYVDAQYTHEKPDGIFGNYVAAPTFEAAMANLADRWSVGTPKFDTVKVEAKKCPLKPAETRALAVAAWHEAFGLPVPTADEMEQRDEQAAADRASVRDVLLAELTGGPAGVKKWNDRPTKEREQIGKLRRHDFTGARLAGAVLDTLDLQGARFDGARLKGACLSGCQLQGASFVGADLAGGSLALSKALDASFEGAALSRCNLRVVSFRRANFRRADLTKADFSYSDLCGADLSTANLDGVVFGRTKFDEKTVFPPGFVPPEGLVWKGAGPRPGTAPTPAPVPVVNLDFAGLVESLTTKLEAARIAKAKKMLKAERFQLFAEVTDEAVLGVVKSQTSKDLVYSCRLAADGSFGCCTQNLKPCGGLSGAVCKHLLVLTLGLAKAGRLDPATADAWIARSRSQKPTIDKDAMSETFLRYKGAEAGEVDWRPTETIPEDFYAM